MHWCEHGRAEAEKAPRQDTYPLWANQITCLDRKEMKKKAKKERNGKKEQEKWVWKG